MTNRIYRVKTVKACLISNRPAWWVRSGNAFVEIFHQGDVEKKPFFLTTVVWMCIMYLKVVQLTWVPNHRGVANSVTVCQNELKSENKVVSNFLSIGHLLDTHSWEKQPFIKQNHFPTVFEGEIPNTRWQQRNSPFGGMLFVKFAKKNGSNRPFLASRVADTIYTPS